MIFSAGAVTVFGGLLSISAAANEILPTLPRYIRKIMTHLDNVVSERVIPVLRPTVPIAEKTSSITSPSGRT